MCSKGVSPRLHFSFLLGINHPSLPPSLPPSGRLHIPAQSTLDDDQCVLPHAPSLPLSHPFPSSSFFFRASTLGNEGAWARYGGVEGERTGGDGPLRLVTVEMKQRDRVREKRSIERKIVYLWWKRQTWQQQQQQQQQQQ